ncbi:hypothetical protein OK18_02010 [Chryseobacterium gallinarum]|uniref:Uncharacterized protein n=1 Tax=Chryseobacterium gallinarum TaxID=1324352 RepID=A0A0G3LXC4_CHRGL|nr:hypothetical protein [Chryseobacterium gallinarum]AKK71576.1 hypothetical protein OK18_02010 [Chryseobacterium gallinarum]
MKFIEIIEAIRTNTIYEFLEENSINIKYESIDVYAENYIDEDSKFCFLDIKEADRKKTFEWNGITYENLYTLTKLVDIVNDLIKQDPKMTSVGIIYEILDNILNGE